MEFDEAEQIPVELPLQGAAGAAQLALGAGLGAGGALALAVDLVPLGDEGGGEFDGGVADGGLVGGDELAMVLGRVRRGGRLVTAGAIAGPVVELDLRRLYLEQRTLIGSTMHTPEVLASLADLARRGAIAPLVAERFPLAAIADAQARFGAKGFAGKLVIEP